MNSEFLKSVEATSQACVSECREKWPMVALSEYIKELKERNTAEELAADAVRGISTNKEFIATKADLTDVKLSTYKIVKPENFAYVSDTSRRGDKISLAFNYSNEKYLVSSISTVYDVLERNRLLPEYLYLQLKRPEFDRYARFNSWGSARETFNWDDMCRVKIPLPPIEVQRACVDAYKGLTALIEENEALAKTLNEVTKAYVAQLRKKWPVVPLKGFIRERNDRNNAQELGAEAVRGISTSKEFIGTKADLNDVNLSSYKIVQKENFSFVSDTSRRGDKISLAFNSSKNRYLVSSISTVFEISNKDRLIPEYLLLQFKRDEFDRYARFNSWGSARETFDWSDMELVKIPLPPIEVQRSIVEIFHCAEEARKIADEARKQLTLVCPAMIQQAAHKS